MRYVKHVIIRCLFYLLI